MSSIKQHEKSITFNPIDSRLEIIDISSDTIAQAQQKNKPKIPEKQKAKFDWNDLDLKAYLDIGADIPQNLWRQENRFLRQVDISKGPIVRAVTAMVRLKAPDYLSNPDDKHPPRREFLYYLEE